MTNYKNTSEDCIKWIDNNQDLFNNICEGLGITTKVWKSMSSHQRCELCIAVFRIFLQHQDQLNLN